MIIMDEGRALRRLTRSKWRLATGLCFIALSSTLDFCSQVCQPFNVLKLSPDGKVHLIGDPFSPSSLNPNRTNDKLNTKVRKRTH